MTGGFFDPEAALRRAGALEEVFAPAPGNGAAGDAAGALDAAWPVPDVALATSDALPAPRSPSGLFPGPWPDWIEAAAEGAGAPPDYTGTALLCAVGAQIGNARWGQPWPGWREPPALYVALVGNPSAGKSPALDVVVDRVAELEAELNGDWEERQRECRTVRQAAKEHRARWEAAVKAAVEKGVPPPAEPDGAREPDVPARRRLRSTDPTVERAAELGGRNPRGLLLVRDELAGWIANMDRYAGASAGGGDRAFWLQAYGGRPWASDRKKDGDAGLLVPHLTWSVIGGIQPDRVASLLMAGDDDGLAARFLFAWPAPGERSGRPARCADLDALRRALRRLRELPWEPPEPVVLPFTDAAAAAMEGWRREVVRLEDGAGGLFLSWVGKLPGFAVRLAVVFEHLAWAAREGGTAPEAVGEDAMRRATAFLAVYAVPMARRVFGEAALPEAERDARRLARWLLRQAPCPEVLNARVLRRQADGPGIPKAERITTALGELAELGWVRSEATSGHRGGRPRGDWAVNPMVRTAAARCAVVGAGAS